MRYTFAVAALGCLLAGSYAQAGTIYEINFSLSNGTIAPTSGTFTYDSTTHIFSGFQVVWDGLTFDLTSSANSPGASNIGTFPACFGSDTGGAAGFDVLSACGATSSWNGFNSPSSSQFDFTSMTAPGVENYQIRAQSGTGSFAEASGSFTISGVPEPATASTLLAGLLVLAWTVRRRAGRQAAG